MKQAKTGPEKPGAVQILESSAFLKLGREVVRTREHRRLGCSQAVGKSFEVQVGPDVSHAAMNRDRMMEFFIENLVMNPKR